MTVTMWYKFLYFISGYDSSDTLPVDVKFMEGKDSHGHDNNASLGTDSQQKEIDVCELEDEEDLTVSPKKSDHSGNFVIIQFPLMSLMKLLT